MAFEVVLCHFWSGEQVPVYLLFFSQLRLLAVPCFMFMSFYLIGGHLANADNLYMKNRMSRLIIPYVGWAVLYFLFYPLVQMVTGVEVVSGISDLEWQLLGGASPQLCPQLWYQADLILLTVIFFLLFRFVSNEKALFAAFCLMVCTIWFQYSGSNFILFSPLRYECRYTLGRISEMLPYAVLGMIFSYYKLYDGLAERRSGIIANIMLGALFFFNKNIFGTCDGFGYQGVFSVCVTICIFSIAYLADMSRLPRRWLDMIKWLAKYSFGVYCIHFGIGTCLAFVLGRFGFRVNTFSECIFIWILCYLTSVVIAHIPLRLCKKLVQ